MIGSYIHLCDAARRVGVWPELHAGTTLHKTTSATGTVVEHRDIVELRLVHDGGKELVSEPLYGLHDLDRAARVLLHYVQ